MLEQPCSSKTFTQSTWMNIWPKRRSRVWILESSFQFPSSLPFRIIPNLCLVVVPPWCYLQKTGPCSLGPELKKNIGRKKKGWRIKTMKHKLWQRSTLDIWKFIESLNHWIVKDEWATKIVWAVMKCVKMHSNSVDELKGFNTPTPLSFTFINHPSPSQLILRSFSIGRLHESWTLWIDTAGSHGTAGSMNCVCPNCVCPHWEDDS